MTREWTGLGDQQEATGHRQANAQRTFDDDVAYAEKSHTHFWVVMVTHRASDQVLEAFASADSTNIPILDADTLAQPPAICCWLCTLPYHPLLKHRKCTGHAE